MNSIDKKPNYKKTYEFLKEKLEKTNHFQSGPFDETYFTMRVYASAKDIIKATKNKKIRKEELLTASILHDVGKTKLKPSKLFKAKEFTPNIHEEWKTHAKKGVPIAKKYLKQEGHSEEFIQNVCHLIENHDKRDLKEKTIELEILQDADLLADVGLIGVIRPFLYAGKFKQTILNQLIYLNKTDRTQNGDALNLEESKKIAITKIKQQKELTAQLIKDIDYELIDMKK